MSSSVSAASLLQAWEEGAEASPGEQGMILLALAKPEVEPSSLADWTVGARDGALLKLYAELFGDQIAALADCPRCGESLEMDFPASALEIAAPAQRPARFEIDWEGRRIAYRLPTAGDLACLGRRLDTGAQIPSVTHDLLRRCLLAVDPVTLDLDPARAVDESAGAQDVLELAGDRLEAAIEAAAAAMDPQSDVRLALECPGCAMKWSAPFDIVGFLWRRLDAWAERTFDEIHALATAYGWAERDILALSPRRRGRYLDMVER